MKYYDIDIGEFCLPPGGDNSKVQGLRFNSGKLRYDLLHPVAQEGLVKVLTNGASKYKPRNWEIGMSWSSIIASLKRHLALIESGEDYDKESLELHIDHIQANAHFLSAYYKIAPQFDDRNHNHLKNKRIALDIDSVLADFSDGWSRLTGSTIPKVWNFDKDLHSKFDKMRKDGVLDKFYLELPILTKPEDIPFEPCCYITNRPVSSDVTYKWLEMNGFPLVPVYTTNDKVSILKQENIDIFVDDCFDNYRKASNAGICSFLFDSPHNKRYNVGFKRITSLKNLI